jgi:hypothetical protein
LDLTFSPKPLPGNEPEPALPLRNLWMGNRTLDSRARRNLPLSAIDAFTESDAQQRIRATIR